MLQAQQQDTYQVLDGYSVNPEQHQQMLVLNHPLLLLLHPNLHLHLWLLLPRLFLLLLLRW
jgi:hypothetical protein